MTDIPSTSTSTSATASTSVKAAKKTWIPQHLFKKQQREQQKAKRQEASAKQIVANATPAETSNAATSTLAVASDEKLQASPQSQQPSINAPVPVSAPAEPSTSTVSQFVLNLAVAHSDALSGL